MPAMMKRKASELSEVSGRSQVLRLEAELSNGQSSLNNITHLLDLAKSDDVETLEQGLLSLYKVFKKLITLEKLKKPEVEEIPTIVKWLRERYSEYTSLLLETVSHRKASLQLSAITLYLRILRDDPLNPNPGFFPVESYGRLINALLRIENLQDSTKVNLREDYLEKFEDLRFYFYKFVDKAASIALEGNSKKFKHIARDNCLSFLMTMVQFPIKDEDINKFWIETSTEPKIGSTTVAGHRKAFSEAWISVLRFQLDENQYQEILSMMHKRIIPHLPKPQLLMDFFTDSYNAGGSTSLLALNGLFYLMQHHNLDYPKFFDKLYALFDDHIMHVRYRSRFFRLVDLFLNSTHISAALITSFLKRMSRLSLTAPPAAIVIVIPLTYNLLKKHPSLMALIHNPSADSTYVDPFDAEETDPAKTGALGSSLWELSSMVNHYHPNVATLARILGEQFTKPSYNLEDFLDHSFTTMTDAEMRKRLKNQVSTAFEKPSRLFPENDIFV